MLIDLNLAGRTVLVVGGGSVGERKAVKFTESCSKVLVVSEDFTEGLEEMGRGGLTTLIRADIVNESLLVGRLISNSSLVVAATDDHELNESIIKEARKQGTPACAVDNPSISDFTMPATATVGDIRIAVSTGGKSPAMAKVLLGRMSGALKEDDCLMVRIMGCARRLVKDRIHDGTSRRAVLYRIMGDDEIKRLLRSGTFEEARARAERIVESSQSHEA
ncbi:MAG: bifunctional precorrin-2 dehydrogenase/sirohydrochlorin ferrochelatase [Candidatus Bathyarchaeia archaeon]